MPYDVPDPDKACVTCEAIPPAAELERLQAENATLQRTAEALSRLESMARELASRPEPEEISVWYYGEMYWAEASAMDGWAGHAGSACELLLGMPGEASDGTHNHQD